MRFVSYNIQYSLGKDGRYDLARTVQAIGAPDVIALQEVTRNFSDVPDRDQPGAVASMLETYYWVFGAVLDLDASQCDVAGKPDNRRTQFGNMVLSRWPIASSRLLALPGTRVYDQHNEHNGALECVIDSPGGLLGVYCVHLNHLHHEERHAQIRYLLDVIADAPRHGGAVSGTEWHGLREVPVPEHVIILGDCNLTPDSREYVLLAGEPDYSYGRRIDARHFVDTWVQAGNERDCGVTWYDIPRNRGFRIDYAFVSPGLASRVTAAWIDESAVASDHQPIGFELDL